MFEAAQHKICHKPETASEVSLVWQFDGLDFCLSVEMAWIDHVEDMLAPIPHLLRKLERETLSTSDLVAFFQIYLEALDVFYDYADLGRLIMLDGLDKNRQEMQKMLTCLIYGE